MDRQQGDVSFLFTDVEGSTGLLQRLGEAYGPVLAAVRQILRDAVAAHGGREVDTRGDELFACFEEPRRALAAALAAQRELVAREWPAGERVRVRMGIHAGHATASDGGYVGLDVHRAARIASAGHGGQILVSGRAAARLGDAPLVDLGEHELPGLPGPERLHQVDVDDLPREFPPLRNARPARPLRVVIADDSVLLREGIARLLEDAGMAVSGQAGTADDLLVEVERHDPDVAIVDIRMPPTQTDEGLRAAHEIGERFPRTAVLVLSQYVEPAYAVELLSLRAEGVGYLLKDRIADVDEFADAVRRVAGGGSAVDREVVGALVGRQASAVGTLTPRERDVLALLAEGRSDAGIGERLSLAPEEVEAAVAGVFEKLRLPPGADGRDRVLAVLASLGA